MTEVIQKSSNVGAVRMAMTFTPREMWELYSAVGFGQKPQIGFPGVVSGRLRPYKSWRPIEQATMSYGYGLSASLFQIAHAYTVFAHDGELIPVTLVKPQGIAPGTPVAGIRVISPKTAATLRDMLHLVTLPGGTAPKAQVIGYSVGGKSGTAYKQEGAGYAQKKYRAWFVGMAPIAHPRIIVAVMVDEPTAGKYFGGDVAAPVFSEVVQQTLQDDGRAARPRRQAADRLARDPGRGGELLSDRHRAARIARRGPRLAAPAPAAPARRRQPRGAARRCLHRLARPCQRCARLRAPTRSAPAPAPAWSRPTASRAFAFADDETGGRVAAMRGLKAAAGEVASRFLGTPSARLAVVAVTGTNGKTSTAWWIAQALTRARPALRASSARSASASRRVAGAARPTAPSRSARAA